METVEFKVQFGSEVVEVDVPLYAGVNPIALDELSGMAVLSACKQRYGMAAHWIPVRDGHGKIMAGGLNVTPDIKLEVFRGHLPQTYINMIFMGV